MHDDTLLDPALGGTSFEPQALALEGLYRRLELAQRASREAVAASGQGLDCPEGCGACCETFIPDILPVEAGYLAQWLLRERPAAAAALAWLGKDGEGRGCPLLEPGREGGKCGAYPARPLICRLFGFSSVRDREGRPAFALCRKMPSRPGGRSWSGQELAAELGASLPDMASYGELACAIAPEELSRRALLAEALPEALHRMRFLLAFSRCRDDDDPNDNNPEPSLPSPRAA